MQISRRSVAIAGLVGGVGLIAYALFGRASDEERIRQQLDRFAHVVGVDGQENPIFRLSRLNKEFDTLVTPDVRAHVPELTSLQQGRGPLAKVAAHAGSYFQSADVSLSDVSIEVSKDRLRASSRGRAKLLAQQGGQMRRDERRVDFTLSRSDGEWLIDSLRVGDAE